MVPQVLPVHPATNLQEALSRASPGMVMLLREGTWFLTGTLTITHPVILLGVGKGRTCIVSTASGVAVHLQGAGRFEIHGIDLILDAPTRDSDVVLAQVTEIMMTGCHLRGGWTRDPKPPFMTGNGLVIGGSTKGLVRGNWSGGHSGAAILVRDEAEPFLVGNTCFHSAHGIFCTSRSRAEIQGNTCAGNRIAGICVSQTAQAVVSRNTCEGNDSAGIFLGAEGTRAEGNICRANAHGIMAANRSTPLMMLNLCCENREHGFFLHDETKARLMQNQACANLLDGIHATDQAEPDLVGNRCAENQRHGINFQGHACGKVIANRLSGNGGKALEAGEKAAPELQDNET